MAGFKDRAERLRQKQEQRRQELLDSGLERYEVRHAEFIEELRAADHEPRIDSRWSGTGDGGFGWHFKLVCRKCRLRSSSWLPKRFWELNPRKRCTGTGPSFEEWVREGIDDLAAPSEGQEHTVVEVQARTVAEATSAAIDQLGLQHDEVDIKVVSEGPNEAVIWARPKR